MDYVDIIFKVVDVPLLVGIVIVIQMLKKAIKINTKWWALAIIFIGFFAAWLKMPVGTPMKDLIINGFVYTAGIEFCYQTMRTVKETIQKEKK